MTDLIICETCRVEGTRSTVREQHGRSTLLHCPAFYDEDGRRHHHDSNRHTEAFRCSNGHSWSVVSYSKCWCGWQREAPGP